MTQYKSPGDSWGGNAGMRPQGHSLDIQNCDTNDRNLLPSDYKINVQHGKWALKVSVYT